MCCFKKVRLYTEDFLFIFPFPRGFLFQEGILAPGLSYSQCLLTVYSIELMNTGQWHVTCFHPRLQWRDRCGIKPHSALLKIDD